MYFKDDIERFIPYNEQEENDKKIMLDLINNYDNILTRDNEVSHFTASSWAVNKDRTKVLMIYHNIYNSWAWTGGHADGDKDLLQTAIRELKEETSVKNVNVLNDGKILSLEIIPVNGHFKRGKFVSSHLHLNVTYLLEVDEEEILHIKDDENSGVKWFSFDEALNVSKEKWIVDRIYKKILDKITNM